MLLIKPTKSEDFCKKQIDEWRVWVYTWSLFVIFGVKNGDDPSQHRVTTPSKCLLNPYL